MAQADRNIEITQVFYRQTLSILFYNLCNCISEGEEKHLNSEMHKETCPYRIEIEKAGIDFKEE